MTMHLEKEVTKLKRKMLTLCSLAQENVKMAIKALITSDVKLAKEVIKRDNEIDNEEVEVEEECLKILALHQPVAIDLRFIISALKINNDLERIGDLATNIAERAIILSKFDEVNSPVDLDDMSDRVKNMLKLSIDALVEKDVALARDILKQDDEIDTIYRKMYEGVVQQLKSSSQDTVICLNILSVSRQLERIADHATNIAEDIIYMIEGTIVRHQAPNAIEISE